MSDLHLIPAEAPVDPRGAWSTLSQAERDRAYDNNAAVPDSARWIADRNRRSAAMRTARASALDVPYGPAERTKFDLYPAVDKAAPCLVHLHGGYWQRNARELFAMLAEGVSAHGWSVAIPGYTLAPDATLTAIVDEVHRALDWLAETGPSYGIAGPVILSGWSAGGHLTAMGLSHPAVAAGLSISGVFDLAPIRDTALNGALRITDEEIRSLSPLRLPVVPKPLAIAYGTAEVPALVWDSRHLHMQRAAAHAPGPLVPVPGADHFSILEEMRRPDGLLVSVARALAADHGRS